MQKRKLQLAYQRRSITIGSSGSRTVNDLMQSARVSSSNSLWEGYMDSTVDFENILRLLKIRLSLFIYKLQAHTWICVTFNTVNLDFARTFFC